MDAAELANRFTYHPSNTPERVRAHETVRTHTTQLAGLYDSTIPDSREKAIALTKLEEALFWANAAIARNGLDLEIAEVVEASRERAREDSSNGLDVTCPLPSE